MASGFVPDNKSGGSGFTPSQGSGSGFVPDGQAPPQHHQGGFMGTVIGAVHTLMQPVHAVAHDLNGSGYVGQQLVKGSDLIAHIPGGLVQFVTPVVHDAKAAGLLATGDFKGAQAEANKAHRQSRTIGRGAVEGTVQSIEHPGRNVLQTALTVLPVVGGVSRVGLVGADAAALDGGIAAKAGTFGKAIVKPEIPVRTLNVPRLESPVGEGPAALRTTSVQLVGSKGSLGRLVQKGHDAVVQRALDQVPIKGGAGRIASYGAKRVAASIEEGSRIRGNVQGTLASRLERSGTESGLTNDEGSLSHFLAANQVTPEEMASYARSQAGKVGQKTTGIKVFDEAGMPHVHGAGETITAKDSARLSHVATVAESLAQKGVLKSGETGQVAINAEHFPQTAASYDLLKQAQGVREQIVTEHGLVNPETAIARKNLVGEKIGTDRPGEVFTTLKTRRPIPPGGLVARTVGKVIPRAKRLNTGPLATGSGLERGMVPENTAGETAGGLRAALRFQNTHDLRGSLADLGSDVRVTPNDVLVAKSAGLSKASLPDDVKVLMGKLTDNTISPEEEQALQGKFKNFVNDHLINSNPEHAVGQRAPEGWKFVHKNLVPDALSGQAQTGGIGKFADTLNSAITSATVYTKLGHLPQRLLTNATANVVQTMNPLEIGRSVSMARSLPDSLKAELEAATGGHASMAPLSGVTTINPIVRGGRFLAGGWARRVDAPFRLNSILYELRQAGIKTPEQIQKAMEVIKDPTRSGLSGSEIMKIDGAVRRSNRAAMMYDGLSNAEKARVAKYMWFYPWTKAAVRFSGHTVAEHPVKAGLMGQAGAAGAKQSKNILGGYPGFENNLTPFSGGKFPIVSDLAALSPYGTTASMLSLASHPFDAENGLPSLANPTLSGVGNVIQGKGWQGFLRGLVSPTPEYQIGSALANPKGKGLLPTSTKNLFGSTGESQLVRMLTLGTATPRRINKAKLNEYYAREGMKKKTFTVYSKK